MRVPPDQGCSGEDAHLAPGEGKPRYAISLELGLTVLGCFTAQQPALGATEIAKMLGVGRARVHRRVATLRELGYLQATAGRRDRMTLKVVNLGLSTLSSLSLPTHAQPYLEELSTRTSYRASVVTLDGHEVVVEATTAGAGAQRSPLGRVPLAGQRLPAYCTAAGKVLLAHLPDYARENLLGEMVLLMRAPNTITSELELRDEMQRIREGGVGSEEQEHQPGVVSLAAPVRNEWGEVVAAVSLSAMSQEVSLDALSSAPKRALLTAAGRISAVLGHRTGG